MNPISTNSITINSTEYLLQRLPAKKFSFRLTVNDWLCDDLDLLHEPKGRLLQLNYTENHPLAAVITVKQAKANL